MKILFVISKNMNIYNGRAMLDMIAALEDRHEIEEVREQKNLITKLKDKSPDIVYLLIGGAIFNEVIELCKGKAVTVSHILKPVDVYIPCDPEQAFPLLVEALEHEKDLSEVSGIVFKHTTPKVGQWDINKTPYTTRNEWVTFSSRGCKGKCSFCNIRIWQGSLRFRTIPSIIEEIKRFNENESHKRHYRFADCSLDSNPPKRMKRLLKALIHADIQCTYGANFRPDFHKLADQELMELLYYSGNTRAFIGVESANQEDLKLYNKQCTKEDAEKTIALFRQYDMDVDIGFIMFNPFSTFRGLRENLEFLKRHHLVAVDTLTKSLQLNDAPIRQVVKEAGFLYGEYHYNFQDKRMYKLTKAIDMIRADLHQNALAQYKSISLEEVKRQKRYVILSNDHEALNIILRYEPMMESVINFESDLLYEWFSKLLDIVEYEKPDNLFNMTNQYINTTHIKMTLKYFKGLEKAMLQELNELNASREEPEKA